MAVPPAVPPPGAPAPAVPTQPVPAGRAATTQTNWIWWLAGGGLVLVLLLLFTFLAAERRTNDGTPAVPAKSPPPAPAVAELERATAIIRAADAHRKALDCDDCSARVETAVRQAELLHLRKQVEELEAAVKPTAPAPVPTAKLDITVRQIPPPPPPPPSRPQPCEPVDPCYRRSSHH